MIIFIYSILSQWRARKPITKPDSHLHIIDALTQDYGITEDIEFF